MQKLQFSGPKNLKKFKSTQYQIALTQMYFYKTQK